MANRYAVASGNWSSLATWDGGASLPGAADIVRPNAFNVTIDQNISVTALRNDASAPAAAGGTFILTGNYTLTISTDIQCFATNLLTYNGTGTAYITGANSGAAIISSTTTNTTSTVTHSGTGTLVVDMVINSCIINETNRFNIQVTGGGTLTCLKLVGKGALANYPNSSSAISITTTAGAVINTKDLQSPTGTGYTINSNVRTTINVVGTITELQLNAGGTPVVGVISLSGADSILNITGNIVNNHVGTGDPRVVILSNSGSITMNGNISGVWNGSTNTCYSLSTTSTNSYLTIIGDIIGGGSGGAGSVVIAGGASITGTITGGVSGPGVRTVSGVCLITGNVTGGSGGIGVVAGGGTMNINGNITGGSGNGFVGVNVSSAVLVHSGTCTASAFASAISCNLPLTSTITLTGPFVSNGYIVPVACQLFYINSAYNPSFTFRNTSAVDGTYVDSSSLNFPSTSNVRLGTSYGAGLYTGTLAMAIPSNVSLGVATDATTGTAVITAADFLTTLSTSSDPLAIRLRNVSTVASMGQQLASYNI
jgi:hypothetical protein